jgi:hypothetical protein
MRVSKAVREYIEKQVKAKYPQTENELLYEQGQQLISQAGNEYAKRLETAKIDLAKQIAEEYGITEEIAKINTRWCNPYETCGTAVRTNAETDKVKRQKAINEKIEDIIVTLELGGTKADLEKMLAEI